MARKDAAPPQFGPPVPQVLLHPAVVVPAGGGAGGWVGGGGGKQQVGRAGEGGKMGYQTAHPLPTCKPGAHCHPAGEGTCPPSCSAWQIIPDRGDLTNSRSCFWKQVWVARCTCLAST